MEQAGNCLLVCRQQGTEPGSRVMLPGSRPYVYLAALIKVCDTDSRAEERDSVNTYESSRLPRERLRRRGVLHVRLGKPNCYDYGGSMVAKKFYLNRVSCFNKKFLTRREGKFIVSTKMNSLSGVVRYL